MLNSHRARSSLYSNSFMTTATSLLSDTAPSRASTPTLGQKPDSVHALQPQPVGMRSSCFADPAVYECRVVRASGLPIHLGHVRTTKYAIEISIGNDVRRTKQVLPGPNPEWDDTLFRSITACDNGPTPITVRILRIRHVHPEEIVASKTLNVDFQSELPFGYRIMTWSLECLGDFDKRVQADAVRLQVAFARLPPQDACTHSATTEPLVTELDIDRVIASLDPDSEWKELIRAAHFFMRAVKPIAEIHPYAALAFQLLSYIPDQAAKNIERDEQVKTLCTIIKDALQFVNESESIRRLHEGTYPTQVRILAQITHQITDCFRFLRTYADEACMWNGMIKHILNATHVDRHVRHYKEIMDHLLSNFRDNALVQIQIKVHSLAEHSGDDSFLKHSTIANTHHGHSLLHPKKHHIRGGADHDHAVFNRLMHWIEDPKHDASRAFLMVSASDRASAVAHEIAWRYSNMRRLASSFSFDAPAGHDGRSMYHSPQMLVASLARDLAQYDRHIEAALHASVVSKPDVALSMDCLQLFEHLVLRPAKQLSIVGPVVVVIDGLHLGGADSERALLHNLLSSQLLQLPANFRFIFAMAPDDEVEKIMSPAVVKVSV